MAGRGFALGLILLLSSNVFADRGARHRPYLDGDDAEHIVEGLGGSGAEINGHVAVACKQIHADYSCIITTAHGVHIHWTGRDGNRLANLFKGEGANLQGSLPVRCVPDESDHTYGCFIGNEETAN